MKPLTLSDPELSSLDLIAENIKKLRELFPELVTEGPNGVAVNVDVLRQLVGDKQLTEADEKYGLTWHGKRKARQLALTPSTGTLRPCPEDSVEWDTTQNLMIEGDNLEVLKLLQKSYAGKVKLIYIDPPYNTGKDFVYPDDFRDNIKNYLELTGQVEGGRKISSNTEASGRFHTDWLTMIYPRLRLAHSLLRDDGVIFVSIDDNEVSRLRIALDELFGEENFIATVIWQKVYSPKNTARHFSEDHDYVVVYAKNAENWEPNLLPRTDAMEARYSNPDCDPRGPWKPGDLSARNYYGEGTYPITTPSGRRIEGPPSGRYWVYSEIKFRELDRDGRIWWGENGNNQPAVKRFLSEVKGGLVPQTLWTYTEVGHTQEAKKELISLVEFPNSDVVFETPKPTRLIRRILRLATISNGRDSSETKEEYIGIQEKSDSFLINASPQQVFRPNSTPEIVLDFFAGTGTTMEAVFQQNTADRGNRRCILVQLPEPMHVTSTEVLQSIADIAKERLRRAALKIKDENPLFSGDLGFRVFKLDSSNIRAWDPDRENLEQTLLDHTDHLKEDRSEADVLFELLLKLGLDLCVPIETRTIAGKAVHAIGGGVLLACLTTNISREDVEALSLGIVEWHQALVPERDTTCVFRDSAFADDVAKTNLAAILHQYGLPTVRSL